MTPANGGAVDLRDSFVADFYKLPPEAQRQALAELVLIASHPAEHGTIYMGGWGDTIRSVAVGAGYQIFWIEGNVPDLLAIRKLGGHP